MKCQLSILLVTLLLILVGCSNTRFLAEDEMLYTGKKKTHLSKVPEDLASAVSREVLQTGSAQKPNNAMFDRRVLPPLGLWVYNYWKHDEQKKIGRWFHNTLSAPPVLISDINPELRAQKMENDLFDMGFFQAKAWSKVDTSARNPKKAMVEYFVEVGPVYRYNDIEIDTLIESIDTMINLADFSSQIKSGEQFKVKELADERSKVSRQYKNLGYFYFNTDFIELDADTSLGNNELNLRVGRKAGLTQAVLSKYSIDSIVVFLSKSSDSAVALIQPLKYEDIHIYATGNYLKPKVIQDALYLKSGDLYSYDAYQKTLARLSMLGVFSYVKIDCQLSDPDSLNNLLNVRIDLTMADQISLDFETDIVMKSTGFAGPAAKVGVSHTNAFKGAEKIQVDLKGAIEWQWGAKDENQLGTFSYEFGVNSSLTFPKLILPGKSDKKRDPMNQETSIQLNFDILNRTQYYSMFSAMNSYKYSWGKKQALRHSFTPLYLNSVSLLETTPAFDSVIDENIYIRKSFEEQFIFGMGYDFSFDNTYKKQPHNIFFQAGASSSGNLLDLFESIGKDPSDRPYEILNTIYSQHLKFTTDFRYYLNGYNKTLATRLYAGIGIPYLNSEVLPYVEQFFSGGAYSIRGFTARAVGPGSYHEEEVENSYIDQSGDMKLEANLEFRFGISKITKGAVFIETGNIWLINEDENRPGSKFDFSTFYNQLAVGTGVGLRFDFNFFVLRTDLGFPLRTPYIQNDKNWLSSDGSLLSNAKFYFAIGYPF